MPPETLGPEPAQQRLDTHVHADEADLIADLGQVQVGRPDHLDLVGIDELMVEDVPGQQHLALAAMELTQVHPGGPQRDRTPVNVADRGGVQVCAPASHPDHDPGDCRIVVAATNAGNHVGEVPHLVT